MFFTLREIFYWIGLSIFEIFVNLIGLFIFTVFLALKNDKNSVFSQFAWCIIFSPLFLSDLLNAFFCIIVFIRMSITVTVKVAFSKIIWSIIFLMMLSLFKFLLCKKFSRSSQFDYSEIFAPLFILLQLIAVRACQMSQ